MKFSELLAIVGEEPLFETGLLLAGDRDPADVRRQLSRWVRSGKLHQLRRGLYALAPPFRKTSPHPFLMANRLMRGSYVSCQSALAHHGLIPEYVPLVTSVGPGRPQTWQTPLGAFEFRHLRRELLAGYQRIPLDGRQSAFVATPEKALLDLVYLVPGADDPAYLDELRLQHLDSLSLERLERLAERSAKPKLCRAAEYIARLARDESMRYEAL